jgi:hypothetical protein
MPHCQHGLDHKRIIGKLKDGAGAKLGGADAQVGRLGKIKNLVNGRFRRTAG